MEILLNQNDDGTSTGFMKTKSEIVMVVRDQLLRVPNTPKGYKVIEDTIAHLESNMIHSVSKRRTRASNTMK